MEAIFTALERSRDSPCFTCFSYIFPLPSVLAFSVVVAGAAPA